MTTISELYVPLARGALQLEPLAESHREALRAACARDSEIWEIYSVNLTGADFDPGFDAKLAGAGPQFAYAVMNGDAVVGCTSWYAIEPGNRAVAIGYTYLAPEVRGGDFNLAVKGLMIGHAWASGFHRIHFDVDVRNARSQAAVLKLGCKAEGVLRHNKVTWTGYLRDTAIFSLLPGEESALLKPHL
ncbi:MAG: GNAT family N-acetyltransferase [Sandarakinorhabdus sp.]|nr:GNAT family N-acetyltransferase [Sandarakinorhabdus sp.]